MHKLTGYFVFLLAIGLTSAAWATDYYASPSGGGSCSSGSPCSFNQALSNAQPGDTVILTNGNYNDHYDTVRSGTSSNRITITAQNKHGAVIRSPQNSSRSHLIDIKHSYITVRYLRIDGLEWPEQNLIRAEAPGSNITGVIIEHNRIENAQGHLIGIHKATNSIIRFNYMFGSGRTTDESIAGEGIYVGSTDALQPLTSGIEIYGNDILDTNGESIDMKVTARNLDIHHNVLQAVQKHGPNDLRVITGNASFQDARDVEFHRNVIRDFRTTPPGWTGAFIFWPVVRNVDIHHNVIRNGTTGYVVAATGTGQSNIAIRNNIVCAMNTYGTQSAAENSGFAYSSNVGYHPGNGASLSTCTNEEAVILAERNALPGSESSPQLTNRYVSVSGSGSVCSSSQPCSLTEGLSQVPSGQTLFLNNGTYIQQVATPRDTITFKAVNAGQAKIANETSTGSGTQTFYVQHSGTIIDGLVISGQADADSARGGGSGFSVLRIGAITGLTVRNSTIEESAGHLINIGGTVGTSNAFSMLFEDNIIRNAGYAEASAQAIVVGTSVNTVSGVTFRRNTITGFGSQALLVQSGAQNVEAYYNTIQNNSKNNASIVQDGVVTSFGELNLHHNIISNHNLSGTSGSNLFRVAQFGNIIQDNVVYSNVFNGLLVQIPSQGVGAITTVSNNVFCSNSSTTIQSGLNVNANVFSTGTPAPGCSAKEADILILIGGGTLPPPGGGGGGGAGLVGHWTFDSTLQDSAGTITLIHGGGAPTYVAGKIGNAIQLNGTSNYASVGSHSVQGVRLYPVVGNPFSVSAWFKSAGTGTVVSSAVDLSFERDFQIALNPQGTMTLYLRGATTVTTGANYNNDAFHHVAVTWSGTTAKWYIDNVLISANAAIGASPEDTAEHIIIGARTGGGGYKLTGLIDDVRIYNRELSATDVANLFTLTADVSPPTAPTNLQIVITSNIRLDLTWTASTDDSGVIARYHIERCQGAACATFGEIDTSNTASYVDTPLTSGATYRYRVRAEDGSGNLSTYSSIAEETLPAAASGSGFNLQLGSITGGVLQ